MSFVIGVNCSWFEQKLSPDLKYIMTKDKLCIKQWHTNRDKNRQTEKKPNRYIHITHKRTKIGSRTNRELERKGKTRKRGKKYHKFVRHWPWF